MPHSQDTVSPEQLAANRANAAKSTGPRTSQGKARSAQNARKHGFTGSTFAVVRLEELRGGRPPQGRPSGRLPTRQLAGTLRRRAHCSRPACSPPRRAPRSPTLHHLPQRVLRPLWRSRDSHGRTTRREGRYRNYVRPESQLPARRRFPPNGRQVQQLVLVPALSGPGGTPLPPRGGGVRKAESLEGRNTERTHF